MHLIGCRSVNHVTHVSKLVVVHLPSMERNIIPFLRETVVKTGRQQSCQTSKSLQRAWGGAKRPTKVPGGTDIIRVKALMTHIAMTATGNIQIMQRPDSRVKCTDGRVKLFESCVSEPESVTIP